MVQVRGGIICILVGTLLGVLTTVLAAWRSSLEPYPPRPARSLGGWYDWKADGSQWHITAFRWRGALQLLSEDRNYDPPIVVDPASAIEAGDLPYWSLFRREHTDRVPVPDREVLHERAYGWPFLSLMYRLELHYPPSPCNGFLRGSWLTSAMPLPTSSTGEIRGLPTGILWKGFLADTALVTPFWIAIPLLGSMLLKRIQRLRRGRCDCCGYDLRANVSRRCPECGHAAEFQ